MKKNNKISEAELEIMKVIWEAGEPVPSTDIVRRLKDKCGWEDTTIYTMLSKLVKKGVLIRDKRWFPTTRPLSRNRITCWNRRNPW